MATVDVSAAAALLLLPGRKEATAAAAVREGWGRYHHGNRLKAKLFRRFCCSNFKIWTQGQFFFLELNYISEVISLFGSNVTFSNFFAPLNIPNTAVPTLSVRRAESRGEEEEDWQQMPLQQRTREDVCPCVLFRDKIRTCLNVHLSKFKPRDFTSLWEKAKTIQSSVSEGILL